ncbi:FMN-dependent alpha-hydroxy acid dehydrogenase family protein [Phanerochaete sordida]|uniref:L-lactate dehydrogenase (cytochrome) n=1 Tax=Phanerochaete sordida TaxID=48140 RepID=A0A9P3G1J9_9APHY|nr:FMN-dependent alpha-hydroxy acid dehydrogenase family protein [Phanerochaete sordida]
MSISLKQVEEHNSRQSCWVIIRNKVYDVTEFLPEHPGGAKIILKYAGKDATDAFEPIHPPDALDKNLPPEKHLGDLESSAAQDLDNARLNRKKTADEVRIEREQAKKPPLSHILNLKDMEQVARKILPYKSLAYFASATDDEITTHENARAYSRFFFHPRILRRLSNCDASTTILGYKSPIPVFVSGAALAKLGHPDGEANITRGAGQTGLIQMVSSNASLSFAEIAAARVTPDQVLVFQLYKHKDNDVALKRIREVEQLGYKAIFLTVDAPFPGNRERDARSAWELEEIELAAEQGEEKSTAELPLTKKKLEDVEEDVDTGGTASSYLANDDVDMTWDTTIPWLRSVTRLPILLKGVQSVEDAVLAAEAGVDGILLSNHGGRQMPYALPPLEVLYRIRQQRPDLFDKMEIYVDGGVTRGSDVLKAVCLGARAVGLGRPFLYAQSAYGAEGVVKVIRILEREIYMCMRLLGARTVDDLVPQMVERVDWSAVGPKL